MSGLHLHLEPVMYVCRGYADPNGYAHKHAYELVLSIFILGDGRARIFAAHGEISRATLVRLAAQLRGLAVDTVLVNRHGVEQEWKVDLLTPGASGAPSA
ncbi:MAG: hypothetical protein ACK4KV_09530 [Rhodocyclaceae bacterium]